MLQHPLVFDCLCKVLEYNSYSLSEIYKQLPNRCTERLRVNAIYNKFMPQYIKSQERRIDNYYITYNPKESIRKRYKQWLRTLYERYPQYSEVLTEPYISKN